MSHERERESEGMGREGIGKGGQIAVTLRAQDRTPAFLGLRSTPFVSLSLRPKRTSSKGEKGKAKGTEK